MRRGRGQSTEKSTSNITNTQFSAASTTFNNCPVFHHFNKALLMLNYALFGTDMPMCTKQKKKKIQQFKLRKKPPLNQKTCCLFSPVVSCCLMTTFVPDLQSQAGAFLGQRALIKFISTGPFFKIQIKVLLFFL